MLKSKHIGLRLGMAFAVLTAMLVGVGQLGLRRMKTIDESLTDITGRRSDKLQLAREALRLSNLGSRITMEIFLVQDRAMTGMLLAARAENSEKISELLTEIARRSESEKEKQQLSAVYGARKLYVDSYLRALHLLVDARKHDAAATVMVNETLPALLKYHAAWDEFLQFQKNQVDRAAKQAEVDYGKARRLASLLIVLAVAVALAISLFATREITREMAARSEAQREVSKLNAGLEQRVMQRTCELTDANKRLEDEVRERRLAEKNYRQEAGCRKSAEHELLRSEERNRMAMKAAGMGYWDVDVIKDEHVWSDTCKALLGVPPDSAANYQVLMNCVHPDDRKMMRDEIDGAIQEKRDYVCEFRVVWPDGSEHWRVSRGQAFYDGTGRPTRMTGISMDIDGRKRAEERLHLQAAALESAANSILVTDKKGTILWMNRAFVELTGYTTEEARGRNPRLLMSGKQSKEFYANLWKTISTGNVWRGELTNRRKDGSLYEEEQTITPVRSGSGDITHFVAVKQDITKRKRSEEMLQNSENKYRVLFEDSADANWLMDENGFLDCNSAALQMFGYSAGALVRHPADISPPYQPDGTSSRTAIEQKIAAAFLNGKERFEWLHQRKNGDVFLAEVCLTALTLSGRPTLLATVRDITDRKVAEERVQYLAYYDALTGLPNRALLQDRLATALAGARRRKDKVALLFLDLDRFKLVNDSLGHSVGDFLLRDVAERLKTCVREQDTVARLGGDEFLVLLTSVKDMADAAAVAGRIVNSLIAEFVVQSHRLSVTCSLGISIFPEHGADGETLIKNADAAMYSSKDNGRNNFRFFSEDMNAQVMERLTLDSGLRLALDKKEFFLMYQPQMDIATGRITGLEALLRWQHPKLGLVPPDKFIQIAENNGLIIPIGEWVLRTACSQARKWQDEGLTAVSVAVNVSAVQFRQEGFCELILRVLHETGLSPQYLELELTESVLLSNTDVMFSVVQKLKAMGLTFAIDDFGTGYSSFSSLKQFRVSKLKIDRSFIRDVAVKPDDAAITAAIISMAKSLALKVIAEGVEDEAQMSFLRTHHCDEIQGYYFSRPLTVDKVADKLRGDTPELHVLAQASGGQS